MRYVVDNGCGPIPHRRGHRPTQAIRAWFADHDPLIARHGIDTETAGELNTQLEAMLAHYGLPPTADRDPVTAYHTNRHRIEQLIGQN